MVACGGDALCGRGSCAGAGEQRFCGSTCTEPTLKAQLLARDGFRVLSEDGGTCTCSQRDWGDLAAREAHVAFDAVRARAGPALAGSGEAAVEPVARRAPARVAAESLKNQQKYTKK